MATTTWKHPVPRVLAPWNTKSECYWLFLTLKTLPEGLYDPLEASSEAYTGKGTGEFKGGLGCVMVVRYSDTPVGSYDELMIIPGNFTVPQPLGGLPEIPKKALRIARIYVSQRTTVYNGRLNWNIAKHLARFSFSAPPTPAGGSPPDSLTIKVYPAGTSEGDGVVPFFACTLKPWRWVPSMPFSTRWLPLDTMQAQPPIPEAPAFKEAVEEQAKGVKIDAYDISPEHEAALMAGTDRWCAFPIHTYVPRVRGCWVIVHSAGEDTEGSANAAIEEAARYWPQHIKPWSFGAWMEDAELIIPKPMEWKL